MLITVSIYYCVWHQLKAPEILQGRKGLYYRTILRVPV